MWSGEDDAMQGLGCPGPCMGADGNLYEWVGGVDGLGNPVGFWKRLRRAARSVYRRAAPFIAPMVAPYAAPFMAPAGPPPAPVAPPVSPPTPESAEAAEPGTAGWGIGADDMTQVMGIGSYVGELAEGPDGNLYQWVQGVDGLGNGFGFWKKLRRRLRKVVRRAMPFAQRLAPFIPGGSAALMTATPWLQRAGVAGDGIGALYEAPDGSLYQVQGMDADDDLQGLEDDDDLRGDDDLQGLEEEVEGFSDDDLSDDGDELRGFADDEMQGYGEEDMQGYGDEEVQGVDGYVRDGVSGVEGFIPDAPRETPWHRAPAQPPPLWSPLW